MPALAVHLGFSATTLLAALSTSTPSSFHPISMAATTNIMSDHIAVPSIPTPLPINIALPNASHPQVNATALVALYLDDVDIILPRKIPDEEKHPKFLALPGRFNSRKGATGATLLPYTGLPHSTCGPDCAIELRRYRHGSVQKEKCICGPDLEKLHKGS